MARCELEVRGRLAAGLIDIVRRRFGDVVTESSTQSTAIRFDDLDSAAQRSLVNLLWDNGYDVLTLHSYDQRAKDWT